MGAVVALVGSGAGRLRQERAPTPAAPPATSSAEAIVPANSTVSASGSSALQPLVNAAKEKFEAANKGISVEVSAGGSKKGLSDVAAGAVQIGDSDIFAPDDLKAQLVDHKVAVVGFAAMANKGPFNEKIAAISLEDLAKIFSGTVTNWKQVGGLSQPIVVINRAPGSGTRSVFGTIVLGGDKFVESQTEDNSGALVTKLKQYDRRDQLSRAVLRGSGPADLSPQVRRGRGRAGHREHHHRGLPDLVVRAHVHEGRADGLGEAVPRLPRLGRLPGAGAPYGEGLHPDHEDEGHPRVRNGR